METNTPPTLDNETNQELLFWHQPEIKRLSVSLDTANATGSGGDGGTFSFSEKKIPG